MLNIQQRSFWCIRWAHDRFHRQNKMRIESFRLILFAIDSCCIDLLMRWMMRSCCVNQSADVGFLMCDSRSHERGLIHKTAQIALTLSACAFTQAPIGSSECNHVNVSTQVPIGAWVDAWAVEDFVSPFIHVKEETSSCLRWRWWSFFSKCVWRELAHFNLTFGAFSFCRLWIKNVLTFGTFLI